MKKLETTIKRKDETIEDLERRHRSAADECLTLRYKNSLIERVILHYGSRPWLRLGICIAYDTSGFDPLTLFSTENRIVIHPAQKRPRNLFQKKIRKGHPPRKPPRNLFQKAIENHHIQSTLESGSQQPPSHSSEHSNSSFQIHEKQLGKLKGPRLPFRFSVHLRLTLRTQRSSGTRRLLRTCLKMKILVTLKMKILVTVKRCSTNNRLRLRASKCLQACKSSPRRSRCNLFNPLCSQLIHHRQRSR